MEMDEDQEEFYDSESEPIDLPKPVVDVHASPVKPNKSTSVEQHLQHNESFSSTPSRSFTPIYAVQFISKSRTVPNETPSKQATEQAANTNNRIFLNCENAMKLCKQDPENRRFKVFKSFADAYVFSYETEIEEGQAPNMSQLQSSIMGTPTASPSTKSVQDAEKLPFAAPKKPKINELRSFIERNMFDRFREKILANPRYLISSGDAPVAFQESFRYNCLHVAAKENRPHFAEFVLNLLTNISYLRSLYRNDSVEQAKARSSHILDLYLNTPEKGVSETPLHFACKFGSLECVRLYLSYDICNKAPLSKFGKTPEDLICTKCANRDKQNEIKALFENYIYVPLYRDEDKGEVILDKPSPKIATTMSSSAEGAQLKTITNSPKQGKSPFSISQYKLAAFVGPISTNIANDIYERLKTPNRLRQSPNNIDILRGDDLKGYERILRKLSEDLNVPWAEYWSFLDIYCNLKSNEGLRKIETYLEQKRFQNILSAQVEFVTQFMNNKTYMESTGKESLADKLQEFVRTVSKLRGEFELKENLLSRKYEKFVESYRSHDDSENKAVSSSVLNEDESVVTNISDALREYFALIVEIARLDNTSKAYFNLYKSAKLALKLLNCEHLYEKLFISPLFKNKNKPCDASVATNTPTTASRSTLRPAFSQIQDRTTRKLSYESDEDEEQEQEEAEKSDLREQTDKQSSDDDSLLSSLKKIDLNDDSELDFLTSKLKESNLNAANSVKKAVENQISDEAMKSEIKDMKEFDDDIYVYEMKSKKNEWPKSQLMSAHTSLFRDIENTTSERKKVFMYGDMPSKLDRAVYLAIQDVHINANKYPLLHEWYNYMKSCKQSDMQKWKTPIKQTPISHFNKNLLL